MATTLTILRYAVVAFLCQCTFGQDAENATTEAPFSKLKNGTKDELSDNVLDLKKNPRLVIVLFATMCGSIWLLYITFFNSRLIGFILTKVINRFFIKDDSYFKIGMFLMFG